MSSYNDVTGDKIQSRINSKQFEDNFDRIFRKKDKASVDNTATTADKPVESTDNWDEKRIDVIGTNGNDGLHYEGK